MTEKNRVPTHPAARRTKILFGAIGGIWLCLGALELAASPSAWGAATFGGGALVVAFTFWLSRLYTATALHNRATDMILRGELDGATSMLDQVKSTRTTIMQSVALQRATIAVAGQSVRAFARASQGHGAGAREDIAAVRTKTDVAALARVAVAELILFSSENDLEGLVRSLADNERVLEFASPRERALVRGFERMVARGGSSVYRKPGSREEHAESAIGDWGAEIAPALRGLMPVDTTKPQVAAEPTRPAYQAAPLRGSGSSRVKRVLALWLGLIFMFGAIWVFLTPTTAHATRPVPSPVESMGMTMMPFVAIIILFASILALRIWTANRNAGKLRALENGAHLGDLAAIPALEAITRGQNRASGAAADLILAGHAERQADFRTSLRLAEEGLSRIEISKAMRNAYADILVPGLHVERGIALAGMARAEEALAACDSLAAAFPGYAFLSTSLFRVRLIAAARARDFERAWEIAQSRAADMPISYRDEFLCAMLEAHFKGVGQDEHARLGHVLRKNVSLRSWIRAVAPSLIEALGFVSDRIDATADAPAPESQDEEEIESARSADAR